MNPQHHLTSVLAQIDSLQDHDLDRLWPTAWKRDQDDGAESMPAAQRRWLPSELMLLSIAEWTRRPDELRELLADRWSK